MLHHASALVHRMQPALGRVLQHHIRPQLLTLCMSTNVTPQAQQHPTRPHTPRGEPKYRCPACQHPIFRFESLERHVQRCCQDLFDVPLTAETWEASCAIAAAQQRAAQDAAVRVFCMDSVCPGSCTPPSYTHPAHTRYTPTHQIKVAFHTRDEHGNHVRLGPPEVAHALSLPLDRAERLLRAAMRAVPLVADDVPVDVVYEDEHVVAVNKPAGVCTAPRHRFEVGVLGFLGV